MEGGPMGPIGPLNGRSFGLLIAVLDLCSQKSDHGLEGANCFGMPCALARKRCVIGLHALRRAPAETSHLMPSIPAAAPTGHNGMRAACYRESSRAPDS